MDSTEIEREAADWLAKRDTGVWRDHDTAEFVDWQSQSTAHRIAVIRVEGVWKQADRLHALGVGVPRGEVPPPGAWRLSEIMDRGKRLENHLTAVEGPPPPTGEAVMKTWGAEKNDVPLAIDCLTKRRRLSRSLYAIVASFLLVFCSSIMWHRSVTEATAAYRTVIGGSMQVPLADGSLITMNTNSSIQVALSATERRIDLEKGEAFFEVAKDWTRPFVVQTDTHRIIAVGTKFSVMKSSAGLRIVITEGQVRVVAFDHGEKGSFTQVPAVSIALVGENGVVVKQASMAEADAYLRWRSGYIALRDTALPDAIAEFNRYNKTQLVIADSSLSSIRIGGNLQATRLDAFVDVLERGFGIRAREEGDRIILTSR